jgi:anaerobic magnesium-protoporphyrin IX monomethyl ester cyclase
VIEAVRRLGVVVVELGFESASVDLLRVNHKSNRTTVSFRGMVRKLNQAGFAVVLNVLSGLPEETAADHAQTLAFIENVASEVWLYNLYNFVPYPLTARFLRLRDRIVDWKFANWRKDSPPGVPTALRFPR